MKHFIGIDFGGTKTAVCLISPQGDILAREQFPTRPAERPPTDVLHDAVAAVRGLYAQRGDVDERDALAVGVSCGGPLDPELGVIGPAGHNPPNLPGWTELDLPAFFARHFPGLPFHVENDANNLAMAECVFGGGRDFRRVGLLLLGTGIGGGFVIDGRLLRGSTGNGAEFGQQRFHVTHGDTIRAETLAAVIREQGESLDACAASVANAANFFDPRRIILGPDCPDAAQLRRAAAPQVLNPLFPAQAIVSDTPRAAPESQPYVVRHPLDGAGRFTWLDGRGWPIDFGRQVVRVCVPGPGVPAGWITLENLCSGKGIVARARRTLTDPEGPQSRLTGTFTAVDVFGAATQNDSVASRVFQQTAVFVAAGVTNIAVLMQPEIVFLCGGVAQCASPVQREEFLVLVREALAEFLVPADPPQVRFTQLGSEAGDLSAVAYWWAEGRDAIRTK